MAEDAPTDGVVNSVSLTKSGQALGITLGRSAGLIALATSVDLGAPYTAGTTLPDSPSDGDLFLFNDAATGLTNVVDYDGTTARTTAVRGDVFKYDTANTQWVRQSTSVGLSSANPASVHGTNERSGTSELASRADHVHDIANNSVLRQHIQDNQINTAKLADDAVTGAEFSAAGSTDGQVWTSTGPTSDPGWEDAVGGGDITGVTTGATSGLAGGTNSGAANLSLDFQRLLDIGTSWTVEETDDYFALYSDDEGQMIKVTARGLASGLAGLGGIGDITGVFTSNTSGLMGGADSGGIDLELDIDRLTRFRPGVDVVQGDDGLAMVDESRGGDPTVEILVSEFFGDIAGDNLTWDATNNELDATGGTGTTLAANPDGVTSASARLDSITIGNTDYNTAHVVLPDPTSGDLRAPVATDWDATNGLSRVLAFDGVDLYRVARRLTGAHTSSATFTEVARDTVIDGDTTEDCTWKGVHWTDSLADSSPTANDCYFNRRESKFRWYYSNGWFDVTSYVVFRGLTYKGEHSSEDEALAAVNGNTEYVIYNDASGDPHLYLTSDYVAGAAGHYIYEWKDANAGLAPDVQSEAELHSSATVTEDAQDWQAFTLDRMPHQDSTIELRMKGGSAQTSFRFSAGDWLGLTAVPAAQVTDSDDDDPLSNTTAITFQVYQGVSFDVLREGPTCAVGRQTNTSLLIGCTATNAMSLGLEIVEIP